GIFLRQAGTAAVLGHYDSLVVGKPGASMVDLTLQSEALHDQRAPAQRVLEADMLPESEYPVVLAYWREPVQRLSGVVRAIREGPRELALTDDEWQTLGLEEDTDAG